MFGKLLHNRWLRLCVGVLGTLLSSAAINLFIVPQNLYTGGLLGFCQLIRTVATQKLGLDMGFDFSGILYLLLRKGYQGEHESHNLTSVAAAAGK